MATERLGYNFRGSPSGAIRLDVPSIARQPLSEADIESDLIRSCGTFGSLLGLILLHERYRCGLRSDRMRY